VTTLKSQTGFAITKENKASEQKALPIMNKTWKSDSCSVKGTNKRQSSNVAPNRSTQQSNHWREETERKVPHLQWQYSPDPKAVRALRGPGPVGPWAGGVRGSRDGRAGRGSQSLSPQPGQGRGQLGQPRASGTSLEMETGRRLGWGPGPWAGRDIRAPECTQGPGGVPPALST